MAESNDNAFSDVAGKDVCNALETLGNELNLLTENLERQYEDDESESHLGNIDVRSVIMSATTESVEDRANLDSTSKIDVTEKMNNVVDLLNVKESSAPSVDGVDSTAATGFITDDNDAATADEEVEEEDDDAEKSIEIGSPSLPESQYASSFFAGLAARKAAMEAAETEEEEAEEDEEGGEDGEGEGSGLESASYAGTRRMSEWINSLRLRSMGVTEHGTPQSYGGDNNSNLDSNGLPVDEWENDDDNGYVVVALSEDEFYDYEEVNVCLCIFCVFFSVLLSRIFSTSSDVQTCIFDSY
jgi:hypothetical protein